MPPSAVCCFAAYGFSVPILMIWATYDWNKNLFRPIRTVDILPYCPPTSLPSSSIHQSSVHNQASKCCTFRTNLIRSRRAAGHVLPDDVSAHPLLRTVLVLPLALRGRLDALFVNNWKPTGCCLNLQRQSDQDQRQGRPENPDRLLPYGKLVFTYVSMSDLN